MIQFNKRKIRRAKAFFGCLLPLFIAWSFRAYEWEYVCGHTVSFWRVRFELVIHCKNFIH